jgi:nicotinate-nucleotide adenylyltransferase
VTRIGVFGSMFDPPHLGHLLLASEAAWQLGLDRVLAVPVGMPPHRSQPISPAETRLRLTRALAMAEPVIHVSRVELDRPGPSYTVDTLEELTGQYPAAELVLLLGADQLAAFGTWYDAERIPTLARIAVAPRPGVRLPPLGAFAVEVVRMPAVEVSSTVVRDRVRRGEPIRHLVPGPVRELIEREGLYREEPAEDEPEPLATDEPTPWAEGL